MTQKFEMADRFNPSAVEQALINIGKKAVILNRLKMKTHRAIALRFRHRM